MADGNLDHDATTNTGGSMRSRESVRIKERGIYNWTWTPREDRQLP